MVDFLWVVCLSDFFFAEKMDNFQYVLSVEVLSFSLKNTDW